MSPWPRILLDRQFIQENRLSWFPNLLFENSTTLLKMTLLFLMDIPRNLVLETRINTECELRKWQQVIFPLKKDVYILTTNQYTQFSTTDSSPHQQGTYLFEDKLVQSHWKEFRFCSCKTNADYIIQTFLVILS